MRFVWLFLLWTMVEIGLFAGLGGYIGVLATWAVVIGTAIGGFLLIRWQKRSVLGQVLQDLQTLGDPLTPAAHSALIVLAGVLLILPGFLTDALGLVLLIPQVRDLIIDHFRERARLAAMDKAVATMLRPRSRPREEEVQEAELVDIQPTSPRPHKPSGWTKP